jgi:hypothetical protein
MWLAEPHLTAERVITIAEERVKMCSRRGRKGVFMNAMTMRNYICR